MSSDPAFQGSPTDTIILTSLGQATLGGINFNRTVRYTVRGPGASAFDGQSVIYGAGDVLFNFINNGEINGNIYLGGTYTDNQSQNLEINGTILQNQVNAVIPVVNWPYWQAQAAADGPGHVIAVTAASPTHSFTDTSYEGIYYVYCSDCPVGNALINNNNMTFNGTLVANGDVTFTSANSVAFNPEATVMGTKPAIIAGGSVNIGAGNNIIFNGSVYAYQNIIMDQTNNLTLNGGGLIFGNDLTSDHTNNIILNTGSKTDGTGFEGGQQGTGAPTLSNFVETR
jgi:hypothetical protein